MADWKFDGTERVNVGIDIGWSERKKSCALAVEGLVLTAGTAGWTTYQGSGRPVAVGLFRYSELLTVAADLIRSAWQQKKAVTAVLDGPLGPNGCPSANRRVDSEFMREPFRGRMQPAPVATGDGPLYARVTDRLARALHEATGLQYRAGWWGGGPASSLVFCETHPTVGLALLLPPQVADTLPSRKRPRRLRDGGPWIRAKSDWYWQLGAGRWVAEELGCPDAASEAHHERVAGLYCLAVARRLSAHRPDAPAVAAVGGTDGVYVIPSVVDRGWQDGLSGVGVHAGALHPQDQARLVTARPTPPIVVANPILDAETREADPDEAEKGDAATLILTDNGGIWEQHNDWLVGLASPVHVRTEDGHGQTIRIERAGGVGQWRVENVEHRPKQLAALRGFQGRDLSADIAWAIPVTLVEPPHMANEVVWYGERGAVNALVTDLAGRQDVVAGVKGLLRAVRWADGEARAWIESVSGVSFLVEVGMGQFGNPDLIMACRTGSEATTHVVFIEAKVVPYLASAMGNAADTMAASGFNSSINGQLALRHRLAYALHRWDGAGVLAEPADLHAAYRSTTGGLCDPASQPRSLAKAAVLDLVRRHGLHRLPLARYHLVAWTWDAGPFFAPAGGVSPDLLPLLLPGPADDRPGEGAADGWNGMSGRVGWVGFREMAGVCTGDAYRLAVATMLPRLVPTAAGPSLEEGEDLKTANFKKFSQETMRLVAEVEGLARGQFGEGCVERAEGSSSVTVAGRVQLKIIPIEPGGAERVLLGIRATLSPRDWCRHELTGPRLVGVGPRRKAFLLLTLGGATGQPLDDAVEVLQLVADRFPYREQT